MGWFLIFLLLGPVVAAFFLFAMADLFCMYASGRVKMARYAKNKTDSNDFKKRPK
jgi:hypothetical protein